MAGDEHAHHRNGGATVADHGARIRGAEDRLAKLEGKLDERSKPQWSLIGIVLSAVLGASTILYGSISSINGRLDRDLVTRGEHEAVGREREALLQVLAERISQIRTEVETIKAQHSSVYSSRDVILSLQAEVQRLRDEMSDVKAKAP